MTQKRFIVALACCLPWTVLAATVPPAEQLLPADTLVCLTIPDGPALRKAYAESPVGQFWQDPEMKAFKDKFLGQAQKEILSPLERELGVKFADYLDLVRGQATLAVLRNDWGINTNNDPSWIVFIDTKEKKDQLHTNLTELRKRWTDAGRKIKTDKIRDVEFSTLIFTGNDLAKTLRKAFPASPEESAPAEDKSGTNQVTLVVGQWESLLLLAAQTKDIERALARLSGGQLPAMADQPEYQSCQNLFKNALFAAWCNFKLGNESVRTLLAAQSATGNPMGLKPEKVYAALGLDGVKSLAVSFNYTAEGGFMEVFAPSPASERKGLLKMVSLEAKNAGPPAFVPADAVRFSRWRFDAPKAWAILEGMLSDVSPEMSSMVQMTTGLMGKNIDPQFDLKKSLIANLGDDFISYQKNPRQYNLAELDSPPAITFIGSPNTEPLLQALRVACSSFAPSSAKPSDREFLGRKIYTTPLPQTPGEDAEPAVDRSLHLAASGGYVALSLDPTLVEEFLRSGEAKPKSLEEMPGLRETAQTAGGFGTGAFWYDNQNATTRTLFETLKKDTNGLESLFSPPLLQLFSKEGAENLKAWVDCSLLPPFEKVAKYFHYSVHTVNSTPEGIGAKSVFPTPPDLKKEKKG